METFVHWDPPTATDNSGTVFTEVHEREGIYSVDTVLVVVYKFYDANYNEAVCTFQVSVVEGEIKVKTLKEERHFYDSIVMMMTMTKDDDDDDDDDVNDDDDNDNGGDNDDEDDDDDNDDFHFDILQY